MKTKKQSKYSKMSQEEQIEKLKEAIEYMEKEDYNPVLIEEYYDQLKGLTKDKGGLT